MHHLRVEVFWQIPHRRDRQDEKALQMPEGVSMLVIDWAIMRLQYIFDITNSEVIGKISSL